MPCRPALVTANVVTGAGFSGKNSWPYRPLRLGCAGSRNPFPCFMGQLGHNTGKAGHGSALIWVESIVGAGHLQVADQLAAALAQADFAPHVVSGSFVRSPELAYGGAQLHPYPRSLQIRHEAEAGFLTHDGRPLAQAPGILAQRAAHFATVVEKVKPAAIITEHWPFGRGYLDGDIGQGLAAARRLLPDTKFYASARDVMRVTPGESAGGSADSAAALLNADYSKVFVHSDPRFMPFERSFPQAASFYDKLVYTGYLVHPLPPRDTAIPPVQRPVLVSAGGGKTADGLQLYETALKARALLPPDHALRAQPWLIMVSPAYAARDLQRLQKQAAAQGGQVTVQRNCDSDQFRAMLSNAALSLSLCGYNTAIEVYAADVPAVLLPFKNAAGGQMLRAETFARTGKIALLPHEERNNPQALLQRIDQVLAKRDALSPEVQLGGAQVVAQTLIRELTPEPAMPMPLPPRQRRRTAAPLPPPAPV